MARPRPTSSWQPMRLGLGDDASASSTSRRSAFQEYMGAGAERANGEIGVGVGPGVDRDHVGLHRASLRP